MWHSSEDTVKIEVWDVVDRAFAPPSSSKSTAGKQLVDLLDARVVDVYAGTHAVIFLVNPFSADSLQYVR